MGLTCSQCVFQWKYNTGNNWGKDFVTGERCYGCGPQEQFYSCSDVSITAADGQTRPTPKPTTRPTPEPTTRPTPEPTTRRTPEPTTRRTPEPTTRPTPKPTTRPPGPKPVLRCVGVGAAKVLPQIARWCLQNCRRGYCPSSHCRCSRS